MTASPLALNSISREVPTARPHPASCGKPAIFGGEPLYAGRLPIARPAISGIGAGLLELCREILESGQLTNGQTVRKLEQAAADYLGVPECVAVSSCTAGLMLVERCLGLRGKVIVPSFTFFATAHSLLWNRLEPVFVDCDPETWNADPERVSRAIRPGVSAILAVHVFGNPCPAFELECIARRAGLRLIFDSAHAFGAASAGSKAGAFGDAEVFSLSPTKLLVAGEGGLITTRNRRLAAALRAARNYGDAGDYDCRQLGLNARLTEIQAAVGLASLPSVERQVKLRNRLAAAYHACFQNEPGIAMQQIRPRDRSAFKDFSIVIEEARFGISRDFLYSALEAENVQVRRYFDPPLHRQRLYRCFYRPDVDPLAITERISRNVLTLPIHAHMNEYDAARIGARILAIRNWAARKRSG
ncbi:MAG TPA: DegT/DnrJ/EryC1/StrS family aminotransferase [Bryobacterales bacterium]|jgi:dTDP-4-amino-4,6-dideoxygalactose transaminase|nr:DegT/DnrJ/EryC1/StrS family aminotransferase [Bryobacterales bacterium]